MSTEVKRLRLMDVGHAPRELMMRAPSAEAVQDILGSFQKRAAQGQRPLISLIRVYPAADLGLERLGVPYVISAGNTRFEALLAFHTDPVTEVEFEVVSGQGRYAFMQEVFTENTAREDANPVDRAIYVSRMYRESGIQNQTQFAHSIGTHPSTVSRQLGLLDAPQELLDLLREGVMDLNHAYDILSRTRGSVRMVRKALRYITEHIEAAVVRVGDQDREVRRTTVTVVQLRRHLDYLMLGYSQEKDDLLMVLEAEGRARAEALGVPFTEGLPEYPESVSLEDALDVNLDPTKGGAKATYHSGFSIQVSERQGRLVGAQTDAKKLDEDIRLLSRERSGEGSESFDREPTDADFSGGTTPESVDDQARLKEEPEGISTEALSERVMEKLSNNDALRMAVYANLALVQVHGGPKRIEQLVRLVKGRVDGTVEAALAYGSMDRDLSRVKTHELPVLALALSTVAADMAEEYGDRWLRGVIGEIAVTSRKKTEPDPEPEPEA